MEKIVKLSNLKMTTRVKLLKEQGIQEKNRQTEIKKEKNE
jgi:hypothetical protein